MIEKITTARRLVHYYQLDISFMPEFKASDGDQFRELLSKILKMSRGKSKDRYLSHSNKILLIDHLLFKPDEKCIEGKIRAIRSDVFPELINMDDDTTRDIDAKENEGIVETTHFILSYSKRKKYMAIEFSQEGAKVQDLVYYIEHFGFKFHAISKFEYIPIVKDSLEELEQRLGKCSEFVVKVHKDNVERIAQMDKATYSVIKTTQDNFDQDYVTVILKYDYRKRDSNSIWGSIRNIRNYLIREPEDKDVFDRLEIKGEDEKKNLRIELFDLLSDKVKDTLYVERKDKSKVLVSIDMLEKMKTVMTNNRLL